jgi:hypothetical protein
MLTYTEEIGGTYNEKTDANHACLMVDDFEGDGPAVVFGEAAHLDDEAQQAQREGRH